MQLRHSKFSQLKARDAIERNCKTKTLDPVTFEGYDPKAEVAVKLWKSRLVIRLILSPFLLDAMEEYTDKSRIDKVIWLFTEYVSFMHLAKIRRYHDA